MQAHRLFEIIYLLMDKKKMTAEALAAHFEVSKRTILRDINTLSAAGVPVYTLQGKGGGIALMDSFVLNKTVLSEEEQDQILFALQGSLALQGHEDERVLSRLQSLFQKSDESWIEVDFSRWGSSKPDKQKFEIIKNAILTKTALDFSYVSTSGNRSRRRAYPLKLVFKARSWYLQAFCKEREDYRTFKISRILQVRETDEHFTAGTYSPPPLETARSDSVVESTLTALELVFPRHLAHRVYDEFDESVVDEDDEGWLHVSVCMPDDDWLKGFLYSFGDDVHIVRREPLRSE